MQVSFRIVGTGHVFGSRRVSNRDLAVSLKLDIDWFEKRTGIIERRICGKNEDVISLAECATRMALSEAGLVALELGHETVVICIQNGLTHMTPPASILLCNRLRMFSARTMAIDGVCAEPINALEIAALMLQERRCERVLIVIGVDFIPAIDPHDTTTAGLFGAGAAAMVIDRTDCSRLGLKGLYWQNETEYWDLGVIPVESCDSDDTGVNLRLGFYKMKGQELAKLAMKALPNLLRNVLKEADWSFDDVDFFVTHQPNLRLLEVAARFLKTDRFLMKPVAEVGNLGPASVLAALSYARHSHVIGPGKKIVMMSFGLGFSCGAAAIQL